MPWKIKVGNYRGRNNMPITVEIPGVGTAEFPDSMSQEDIGKVLSEQYPAQNQPTEAPTAPPGRQEPQITIETPPNRLMPVKPLVGALPPVGEPSESIIGLKPEIVPPGTTPITSALSAVGKAGVGALGYMTSPQGMAEGAVAMTPAAPAVVTKWAVDMIRGGITSAKDLSEAVAGKLRDTLNVQALRLQGKPAPKEEPKAQQEFVQRVSEDAVNTAFGILGGLGAAHGAVSGATSLLTKQPRWKAMLPSAMEEARKSITEDTKNASKVEETAEVHGDVRPLEEPASPLSTKESGERVQPPPEAPKPEVPLAPTPPVASPTPEATVAEPGQLGGGAAHISEFEVDPGNPDIYGIAARVRAQRAQAGQTVTIEPGQGVSAVEAVAHGQEVLEKNPLAAEQAVDAFKKNNSISFEGITATRAKAEKEFQEARRTEEKLGTDSPEYQTAKAAAVEWDKASKEMQTEWHKAGRAQQGQTDIDTGTFTGLDRAFQQETGKPIPEAKVPKAKKIAKDVTDARGAAETAKAELFKNIRERSSDMSDAEKRAFDAAKKTIREWAVTKADAESKLRVAQKVQADAVKKVQDAAAERARRAADKTLTENAKRLADEETARRVKSAQLAKESADVEVRRQEKRAAEASKRITKAAADAAKAERKLNVAKADLPTYVWTKAREYIEKGMDNFDDIRVKIATDEGLPLQKVTEAMGKDKRSKFLADEVWRRQQHERRLREQAKRWLTAQTIPEYQRWFQNIPAAMFTAKVMGHGTVALGTHAPMGLFKPMEWGLYFKNFGRMYRMVGSKAFYENQIQDLLRNPNYTVARRAGLVNDPYQFEDYNSPDMLKWMDKFTAMGNRGYGVLKLLRQDMFDRQWNKLPKTMKISKVAEGLANDVNHATGVVKVAAPKGTAVAFFAPRLELSRLAYIFGDTAQMTGTFLNWKNATPEAKIQALRQAKERAWVLGTGASLLALNQGVLSAVGSDQKINGVPEALGGVGFDPMRSDFLKFKAFGMQGSYGNAMTAMARLPARLWVGIKNEGKLNKIVHEDENIYTIFGEFARSQFSPFMGTTFDLAVGSDFQRRPLPRKGFGFLPGDTYVPKRLREQGVEPYTWTEYLSVQGTPIPFSEAIREVWKHGLGMSEEQMDAYMKAFAILSIMTATGGRVTEDYTVK